MDPAACATHLGIMAFAVDAAHHQREADILVNIHVRIERIAWNTAGDAHGPSADTVDPLAVDALASTNDPWSRQIWKPCSFVSPGTLVSDESQSPAEFLVGDCPQLVNANLASGYGRLDTKIALNTYANL